MNGYLEQLANRALDLVPVLRPQLPTWDEPAVINPTAVQPTAIGAAPPQAFMPTSLSTELRSEPEVLEPDSEAPLPLAAAVIAGLVPQALNAASAESGPIFATQHSTLQPGVAVLDEPAATLVPTALPATTVAARTMRAAALHPEPAVIEISPVRADGQALAVAPGGASLVQPTGAVQPLDVPLEPDAGGSERA